MPIIFTSEKPDGNRVGRHSLDGTRRRSGHGSTRSSDPRRPAQNTSFLSRLFETRSNDYELYEEDDEFVLSVELPGFEPEEIGVSWDDGVLNIAAEHEDDQRGERKTYHRRFRFPKTVEDDDITAQYTNGILEVRLPVMSGATTRGKQIEVQA